MESRHPNISAPAQTPAAQKKLMQLLRDNNTTGVEDMIKNKKIVKLDLQSKIDGTHPLSVAILKKNTSLVRLLLKNGAALNSLHFFMAISNNVPADLLEEILAHMADSHHSIAHYEMSMSGLNKLLERVPESKRENVINVFKKYGIDMTSDTSVCQKFTPLHAAVLLQSPIEIIEMLLRYDANNHHCIIKAHDIAKAMENNAATYLLEGEEIPAGQSWIINAVKTVMPDEAAAYGEIEGLCYALALKHGEAFLLNQCAKFNKKFGDIANINIDELNDYMNKAECEVLTYETRRASLTNKMSQLIDKKDSTSTQELTKFSEQIKYLDMFQEASEKTLELNTLITDTFKLTLNPKLDHSTDQQYLSTIGWDKASLAQGGIRVGHCYTGMYNVKELSTYLKELAHFAQQIDYPFSLHLDNWGHAVNLCYDKKTKTFIFFDANAMPAKKSPDTNVVSKWIMEAIIPLVNETRNPINANDTLCLQSRFLVTGHHIQCFKTDVQKNLLERTDWQKIHEPTQTKITSLDSVGHSWLLVSVQQKENPDEIKELISKGANPNLMFKRIYLFNSTPLFLAVARQNITLVEALLNAKPEGANPNQLSANGLSPLHKAVATKNVAVVEALLNAKPEGADPNLKSTNGFTPLYLAVMTKNVAIVEALLNAKPEGANPNLTSTNGYSPLYLAVATKNVAVVEALLNAKPEGANPNQINANGFSPLYKAIQLGDIAIVKLLLNQIKKNKQEIANVAQITKAAQDSNNFDLTMLVIDQINDEADARRQREKEEADARHQLIPVSLSEDKRKTTRRVGIYKPRRDDRHVGMLIPTEKPLETSVTTRHEGNFKRRKNDETIGVVIPEQMPETAQPNKRREVIFKPRRDDHHIGMLIPTEKPLETSVTTRHEGIFKRHKDDNQAVGVVIPEHMPETAQPNKRREVVFKIREENNQAVGVVIPTEKPEAKKPSRRLELSDDAPLATKDKRRKEASTSETVTIPTEKPKRKQDVQHREYDLDVDALQKMKQQKKIKEDEALDTKITAAAKKKDVKPGSLGKSSVFSPRTQQKKQPSVTSKPAVASKKLGMSKKAW